MMNYEDKDKNSNQNTILNNTFATTVNENQLKKSFKYVNSLFNPHLGIQGSTTDIEQIGEPRQFEEESGCNDDQVEFEASYPKEDSYQSLKTLTSSSNKDEQIETIFIPIVQESYPKARWESDNIIPEEREEVEMKEEKNSIEVDENRGVLDIEYSMFRKECLLEIPDGSQENVELLQEENGRTVDSSEILKVKEGDKKTPKKLFRNEYLETISVKNSIKEEPTCFKEEFLMLDASEISSVSETSEFSEFHGEMKSEIIQQEFISKATVFYEKEKENLSKNCFHVENISNIARTRKLSFSSLETISIRPIPIENIHVNQQTERSKFSNSNLSYEKVSPFQQNLRIVNQHFNKIDSVKKQNLEIQTNFQERLIILSKAYEEKIGIIKEVENKGIQNVIECSNIEIQTEKNNLSVSESYVFSVSVDTEKRNHDLERLENYLRELNEQRKKELKEEREKKYVSTETNTENYGEYEKYLKYGTYDKYVKKERKAKIQETVAYKSFGSQYNDKDTGIKVSLKRLEINEREIICIDDDEDDEIPLVVPKEVPKEVNKADSKSKKKKVAEKVDNVKTRKKVIEKKSVSKRKSVSGAKKEKKSKKKEKIEEKETEENSDIFLPRNIPKEKVKRSSKGKSLIKGQQKGSK